MSGIRVVQEPNPYNYQSCILANSAHLDPDDPVYIDSSGFLNKATTSSKVQGYYVGASVTATSDNQTVALQEGTYQPVMAGGGTVFEGTADQACTQTDIGAYADFAINTNAFTINLAAGASGQVEIIDFDPNNDGTTTLVRFVIAEPQALAFAQA